MADPIQDARDKAWALDAEARQAWVEQDFTRSRQLFEQALEIFRSIIWKEEIIYGLIHVTQAMAFGPDYQPSAARPLLEEALQLAQDLDSARYLLPVQINRIRVMIDSGENAAGLALAQEYLPVAEKFADKNFICSMLTFVSFALVGLGLSEDALRMFAATEAERSHQGVKITDPVMVKSLERRLRPARSTLTAERQEQVEAEGYEMSLEQAVKYALAIRSPRK